jgi:hypothetical protein
MKTLMKLRKEVSHGGEIPPGWQMARYEPRQRVGVYYSAPLHSLAGVLREVINRVHRERLAEECGRGYLGVERMFPNEPHSRGRRDLARG